MDSVETKVSGYGGYVEFFETCRGSCVSQGGYEKLFHAVRETLADISNMVLQVVCPKCLRRAITNSASFWSWDDMEDVRKRGNPHVYCIKGHRVDTNLLCGLCTEEKHTPLSLDGEKPTAVLNINEVIPSVVLVCVWDHNRRRVISCGSGFVCDRKLGLVVTAGHVVCRYGHTLFTF